MTRTAPRTLSDHGLSGALQRRHVPRSLAGRVETIELLPFSQAELAGGDPPTFVERASAGDFASALTATGHTGPTADLVERVVAGGYPEALSRSVATRRQTWLRGYARALAERDATEIATIGRSASPPKWSA